MRKISTYTITVLSLLLLIAILWDSKTLSVWLAALWGVSNKPDNDSKSGIKFCYPAGLTSDALSHTLLNTSAANYFNLETGVLSLPKIGLEEINSSCALIPDSQVFKLVSGINSVLLNNKILFIGENHLDYFSISQPEGADFMQIIIRNIPENGILFTEVMNPKNSIKKIFNEKNFSILKLDDPNSYYLFFSRLAHLLPSVLSTNNLTRDLAMEWGFVNLFFYDRSDIWSQILKQDVLTPGESKLCERINSQRKQKSGFSISELQKFVKDAFLSPLINDWNMRKTTFSFFLKLLNFIDPKLELSKNPITRPTQLRILNDYKKELSHFLKKLRAETYYSESLNKSYEDFDEASNTLAIELRNTVWIEFINKKVDKYVQEHDELPHIIIYVGEKHIPGLQKGLKEILQDRPQSRLEL